MSKYRISLVKVATSVPIDTRWCIDFPMTEQQVLMRELQETGVYFQGWLVNVPTGSQIYLQQDNQRLYFPLNSKRPDVIERILQDNADDHPQLQCGFSFHAVINSVEFELGIVGKDFSCSLVCGQINGEFKVLFGGDNWLFLDNDTNQSVEQHTGRLLLSRDAKLGWQEYFEQSQAFLQAQKIPYTLLIAPSKEAVFPEHYPYPKAKVTPVEQVLSIKPGQYPVIYPVKELKETPLRSFRLNDTHWSAMGGKTASVLVAEQLGFEKSALELLFQQDNYQGRQSIGDLGNKIYPPIFTEEFFLTNFAHHKFIKYDNALPNFGRSMVISNPTALSEQHCLMFASSSGYTMLEYLCRIFRQITFIHTSGSIDEELCKLMQPDVLVSQTNARYVLRPPMFHYRLKSVLREKLAGMDETSRASLIATAGKKATSADLPAATILQSYLETA